MSETTAIEVRVSITLSATCPNCVNQLVLVQEVDEESLRTGNTTQRAAYWVDQLKAKIQARKSAELWSEDLCGRCRIARAEEQSAR